MKKYKGYLFDMDGTLVDSESLKGRALAATCGYFGGQANVDAYKTVMGNSWAVVTAHFFKTAGIEPPMDRFNHQFKKYYEKLLSENLSLNTNAEALLKTLFENKKKIGVVSSSASWMADHILHQLKIFHFFDFVITREDVSKHKPDPEAYLLALDKMSLSASEVLVFEDSHAGLMAAEKAGCDVIAFRHAFNENNDLSIANWVISDFNEVRIE